MAAFVPQLIVIAVVRGKRDELEKSLLPQLFRGWRLLSREPGPTGVPAAEILTIAPGRALYPRDASALAEWKRQGQVVQVEITPLESRDGGLWGSQVSTSCRSSDGAVVIPWVNVTEWFDNACDDAILALLANEDGRRDSNGVVALLEHFEKRDTAVADLFAYSDEDEEYAISIVCLIDQQEAGAWLERYRPHLLVRGGTP